MIAGCEYVKNAFSTAFPGVETRLTGTPRNDVLINGITRDFAIELKEKMGLPSGKRVILFAPTFRNDPYESGRHQLEYLNIQGIINTLELRFGGKWIFVYRVHHEVYGKVDYSKLSSNERQIAYPGNLRDDMAEYLSIADALITDYSGSMHDFALTRKPCFLFALDRDHYEKEERGFYDRIEDLPFSFSETNHELLSSIRDFDSDIYAEKIEQFLKRLGNVEDGKASKRIAEDIAYCFKGLD